MSLDPETLTPAQRAAAMLPGFLQYEAEQRQKKREARESGAADTEVAP